MPERTPRQIYATQKRALTSMQKKLEAMASQWADIDNGTMWALQELADKIEAASHEMTAKRSTTPPPRRGFFSHRAIPTEYQARNAHRPSLHRVRCRS